MPAVPMPTDPRRSLLARYRQVRTRTEAVAAPLSAEDQCAQSMPDASPVKWHRAHTTWFFEEFVLLAYGAERYRRIDDRYSYLYNSYYDAVGDRHPRPERGLQTRPSHDEVTRYRAHVDDAVIDLVDRADRSTFATIAPLIELGLHHEEQHQELALMDVKHLLSRTDCDPAYRAGRPTPPDRATAPAGWVDVGDGIVDIGHDPARGFAFDNESPRHTVLLTPFRIANRLVTCGEWKAFIADDGYRRPDLWLSDGWHAAGREQWQAPLYWKPDGDSFTTLTLDGRRPVLDADPVVHVSHYEADAFARWAGARLPTEFEWEAATTDTRVEPLGAEANLLDDDILASALHPTPADVSDPGLRQAYGDVWEWTASAYLPYPRFTVAPGAVGEYNGKFMSGQMVLRGGAAITPRGHVRPSYRNFFPPAARWVFGGLRLASDS